MKAGKLLEKGGWWLGLGIQLERFEVCAGITIGKEEIGFKLDLGIFGLYFGWTKPDPVW